MKAILSWSSGKDSAWTLQMLRQQRDYEIVGLLTSFNEEFDRVAMHAVRRSLVEAQAAALSIPLFPVELPWPCTNEIYEERMGEAIEDAASEGVTHIVFGDLFLEDIRAYRERQFADSSVTPLFPLWGDQNATARLARDMVGGGLQAVLTCVDGKRLDKSFVGRQFDADLLDDLPEEIDPCGERGEFHTFCYGGPMFKETIAIETGKVVDRDGFWFVDVLPAQSDERA